MPLSALTSNTPGIRIAYAEITTTQTFTTIADITGLTVTIPAGLGRPVRILFGGYLSNDNAGGGAFISITNSGDVSQGVGIRENPVPAASQSFNRVSHLFLPAGTSGVYKLRANRITAGTLSVIGAADSPFFIEAVVE